MTNAPLFFRTSPTRFFGKLVAVSLCVCMAGFSAPTMATATNVPVDQQPLTIRKPLPPNIMLMLDDSGSMMWDVMPDWGYLGSTDELALINSTVNGVYYNPSVTYIAPPTASGGSYPDVAFDDAPVNGFDTSTTRPQVDLTTYAGGYDSSDDTSRRNGYPDGPSKINYSVTISTEGAYAAPANCPSGTTPSSSQDEYCYYSSDPLSKFYEFRAEISDGTWYVSKCNQAGYVYNKSTNKCLVQANVTIADSCPVGMTSLGSTTVDYDENRRICSNQPVNHFFTYSTRDVWGYLNDSYPASAACPADTTNSGSQDEYCYYDDDPSPGFYEFYGSVAGGTYYVSKCNDSNYRYNKSNNRCLAVGSYNLNAGSCPAGTIDIGETTTGYSENRNICASDDRSDYTITDPDMAASATATYTRHYVGKRGDCADAGLSSDVCVDPSQADPSDPSVPDGMSGTEVLQNVANWFAYYHTRLLMAKSGLMRAFSTLNPTYRFGFGSINGNNNDDIPSPSVTLNSRKLAEVRPFGDGTTGTQKASFWTWVANERPVHSTPLRMSLEAVGMYYDTKDQPWQTSSTDTTMLACRQSYAILTTDGFWNSGSTSVGDQDSTAGSEINGPNSANYTYSPRAPFSDGVSNTLADVAMKYWKSDLTDLTNEVPTNQADPAFWQHMVTFTLGMGFRPVGIEPEGTTVDQIFGWAQHSGNAPADFDWPTPSEGSQYNIADMAHAAVNGHGGFYSATDPNSFVNGLKNALNRAAQRVGSGASLASNSTKLQNGTVVYQGIYHTAIWTGELKAFTIDPDTGALSTSPLWSAARAMPAPASRNIWTYDPANGYVTFKQTNLSSAQLAYLGADAASQTSIIKYLRGNHADEKVNGGTYRNRSSILGDIVDSQPVYVGTPLANVFYGESFAGSSTYPTFASNQASRNAVIYVAANDGMLHAFDADTGEEVYAFIPATVISHGGKDGAGNVVGVSELADPDYGTADAPHQFFNDGQLTVADAYFDSGTGAAWHTVLVGTTGRGLARTIYALDVTDPSNIKFLWERSAWDANTNSDYIGQITSKPVVVQVADGQWAVLVGNGYNSTNGTSALLQFDLSDGTFTVHTTTDTTTGNGLAGAAVWIDSKASGISSTAYAGDLHGHIWSFQLSKHVSGVISATPSSVGSLIYTTKDGSGNAQPITAPMRVGRNPTTGSLWLFFGTGRYLASSDISDTSLQTWYGLIVRSSDASHPAITSTDDRTALAARSIIAQTPGDPNNGILPARVMSDGSTVSMDGKSGWYIDLQTPIMGADAGGNLTHASSDGYTAEGERMISPNLFYGSYLVGTSIIPKSTDLCNPSGTGWTMVINPFTGTNPELPFYDINNDGIVDGDDKVSVNGENLAAAGIGHSSLPNAPIFVSGDMGGYQMTSHANATNSNTAISGTGGALQRVSWREVVNH